MSELIELKNFALAEYDVQEVLEAMEVNLQGDEVTPFDFDRIKVPSGGGTVWQVETLEGKKNVEEIKGVILYHSPTQRAYWENEYDGSSNPPDCRSLDGVHGEGNPGGICASCPMAAFGSAAKGEGQACKQIKFLFILTEDSILPTVISAPPTSLSPVKKYMLRLSGKGIPYFWAMTSLKLETDKNSGGITYSKIKPELIGRLDKEAIERIKTFKAAFMKIFEQVKVEAGDYGNTDTPQPEPDVNEE